MTCVTVNKAVKKKGTKAQRNSRHRETEEQKAERESVGTERNVFNVAFFHLIFYVQMGCFLFAIVSLSYEL